MMSRIAAILSIIALALSLITLFVVATKVSELETLTNKHCLDCDEAMQSIASSFKMNRLNYELHWTTPEGVRIIWGKGEIATLEGGN